MGCVGKLPGKPSTVAEMEESVAPELPELKDWRSVSGSYFEPFGSAHWTNAVTCQSNQFRDKYLVSHLTTAVEHGERVFAIVGVGLQTGNGSLVLHREEPRPRDQHTR
jgi:hypothetical protein